MDPFYICYKPNDYNGTIPHHDQILVDSEDTEVKLDTIQACRVCLQMNGKLYSITNSWLSEAYSNLTGSLLRDDDGVPQTLCVECVALLKKCHQFRMKGIQAQELWIYLELSNQLTPENILETKQRFDLSTNLSITHYDVNYCDIHYIVDEQINEFHDINDSSDENIDTKSTVEEKLQANIIEDHNTEYKNILTNLKNDVDNLIANDNIGISYSKNFYENKKYLYNLTYDNFKYSEAIDEENNDIKETQFNEYFEEATLDMAEQRDEILLRKESENYKNALFKCEYCFKGFMHQKTYAAHMQRHYEKNGSYLCDICQTWTRTRGKLKNHLKQHEKIFTCKKCFMRFQSRSNAEVHMQKHEEGKDFDYFDKDDISISTSYLQCSESSTEVVKKPKGKRRKKKTNDYVEKTIYCEQCGLEMPSFSEYRRHFFREHPHMTRTQTSFGVKKSATLCDICGKICPCLSVLREHIATHTIGKYECDECECSYTTRQALMYHKRMHRGVRYPCHLCGRTFTQQGNMTRHVKYAHTNVRDLKCVYCDKYFKNVETRNFHMSHVHMKKPWPKRVRSRPKDSDRKED